MNIISFFLVANLFLILAKMPAPEIDTRLTRIQHPKVNNPGRPAYRRVSETQKERERKRGERGRLGTPRLATDF